MVHYSDSSDGEDERDKKADKGGKDLSKALPQEQAMIRFKYRGTQHPLVLKTQYMLLVWFVCTMNQFLFLFSSWTFFQVLQPGIEEKYWQLSAEKKMTSFFFETAKEMNN